MPRAKKVQRTHSIFIKAEFRNEAEEAEFARVLGTVIGAMSSLHKKNRMEIVIDGGAVVTDGKVNTLEKGASL